jgi:hypothetical protein
MTNIEPIDTSKLNPGIRELVKALRADGFDTRDSGDGKTHEFECDQPYPYVHIVVGNHFRLVHEVVRLKKWLADRGVIVEPADEDGKAIVIEGTYNPAHEAAVISLFNVTDKMLQVV